MKYSGDQHGWHLQAHGLPESELENNLEVSLRSYLFIHLPFHGFKQKICSTEQVPGPCSCHLTAEGRGRPNTESTNRPTGLPGIVLSIPDERLSGLSVNTENTKLETSFSSFKDRHQGVCISRLEEPMCASQSQCPQPACRQMSRPGQERQSRLGDQLGSRPMTTFSFLPVLIPQMWKRQTC